MGYKNTGECIEDLERHGHLVRIREEVSSDLEMAAIHLRVYAANGPALLFENIKNCKFRAASNLYGSLDRSRFIFRDTLEKIKVLIDLKNNPLELLRHPFSYASVGMTAWSALPRKSSNNPVLKNKTHLSELPQIKCWPKDGGAFITLPLVYTEDADKPGVMNSNLGMYRIQISGNDYKKDTEAGLHYQLHRGIGVHQAKSNKKGQPLKVSVFVGGPPSLTLGAIMPLPEGMSELTFAGALGNRRIRYCYDEEGFAIAGDADFVITGEVYPDENKPEGPFGDHLGYYSLKHDFPLMRIRNVYHRNDAIWPFTVVGRPPQEDTSFGALIHEITGNAIPHEIPGLKDVHAVDAAGVHPLLLAIGSERYTPYIQGRRPAEILTIANHILGKGQLSLAKYLFIVAGEDNPKLTTHNVQEFFIHVLERIDLSRDLHFHTRTTIDTLDYTGMGLNSGSKVVIAAAGEPIRSLGRAAGDISLPEGFTNPKVVMPGILAVKAPKYVSPDFTEKEIMQLDATALRDLQETFPLIVLCNDSSFVADTLNNFLWVTFTRSNPSHDIHGIREFIDNKHWGCHGPLIIDARIKPHHAPPLEVDPAIEKKVDRLGEKGGSLYGII